jgi:hypothetical protein
MNIYVDLSFRTKIPCRYIFFIQAGKSYVLALFAANGGEINLERYSETVLAFLSLSDGQTKSTLFYATCCPRLNTTVG